MSAGRARVVQLEEIFTKKLTKNQARLEVLIPDLDSSEEDSNQIKEQHKTKKLQIEELILKKVLKTLIMN